MADIRKIVLDSIRVKEKWLQDDEFIEKITKSALTITNCFRNGGNVWFCGNGGSAADAQHLAAELTGRFYKDRAPLSAEALHVNTSFLTAVGNDYGFEEIYARLLRGKGRKKDVLVAISTSGNSANILKVLGEAKKMEIYTIGFTGESGGKMKNECDLLLNVPSSDTPRIQESHILIGHILCQIVEENMF